jgi:regulator of sigma E protease
MALISLNLGVLNLVPIPVLDGFHVLSAGIEAVRRRPLSLRFREVANLVGVALVLALMLFALRNDAVRMFLD